MSSNDILTTLTRPEEANSERLNQSASSPAEPKQSIENVLLESKRLIKSGLYKKAFNLVEALKAEEAYIPPLASIKLSRRMVICLTRICTRYLTKGDLHRVDHFLKLMYRLFDYMQTWHDLLYGYISKTNPKFNHLRKILNEPSELFEDGVHTAEMARIKIKKPTIIPSTQNNLSILSTAESREGKSLNMMNRFRQNLLTRKDSGPLYVEDPSRFDQESQLLAAELSGNEINASYHLDEFIKYYMISLLNWSSFYKTVMKKYDLAYRFLLFAQKITKVLDSCLDPEVLQLVSKVRIALGVLYSEFGKHKDALETLESALNLLQIEITLRISRNKENKSTIVQTEKFKETIRQIILVVMNMAIIYEQKEDYARTLESLRLGVWFAGKFLTSDEDILNIINMQCNIASQRYDKYLKELGELERVVPEKKENTEAEDTQQTKTSNHVSKMNYYLYNKFNYDKLNSNQYIVLTSPSAADKDMHVKNNRSEFLTEDRTEFGESKNWSRLRELKTEGSFARTGTMDDIDMQHTSTSVTWKRQGTMTKGGVRDKRKLKLDTSASDSHTLTSRRYHTEGAFEHDKEEFQLDSEDEREYIEKLNRNIKEKRKTGAKKNGTDYLDVDGFFNNVVDKRIKEKEEELKIGQPKEFKRIVKDYGYFVKSEKFDEIEFGFAARTLTARARENLGDYEILTKYKPPTFKVAQRNEVKIEAQHVEARLSTENRINQRNQSLKSLINSQVKSPQAKMVKFATSTSGRETKTGTLLAIDEQQPSTSRSNKQIGKHTFTGVLMKHHEDLGLNTVYDVANEREKRAAKLAAKKKEKIEMKNLGLLSPSALNRFETPKSSLSARSRSNIRRFNTQDIGKFAETTKNTIQLMMESIEKNIEDDEDIKHRIEYNKPLIQVQKSMDKFLKVPDELAKSTVNLSFKTQGGKKIYNFSQLVKHSQVNPKKTVTIMAP